VAEIDAIDDSMYDDSTLILRLIRDNLTIWIQENGGESYAGTAEDLAAAAPVAQAVVGEDLLAVEDRVQTDLVATAAVTTPSILLSLSPSTGTVESQPDRDRQSLQDNVN